VAARHFPLTMRSLDGITPEQAAAHGRIDREASCETIVRGLAEVVLPSAKALLGRTASGPGAEDGPPATRRSPA